MQAAPDQLLRQHARLVESVAGRESVGLRPHAGNGRHEHKRDGRRPHIHLPIMPVVGELGVAA